MSEMLDDIRQSVADIQGSVPAAHDMDNLIASGLGWEDIVVILRARGKTPDPAEIRDRVMRRGAAA